jgi:LacI family transcriptional regulator
MKEHKSTPEVESVPLSRSKRILIELSIAQIYLYSLVRLQIALLATTVYTESGTHAPYLQAMKSSRPHPTLADVARLAGVGKTTVSRVINGGHKVGPRTLARINQVIREIGYHPSQAARSLKGERTKSIGLILPRIADPFFSGCAEAVQSVARSEGHLLMVSATDYDPQIEIDQLYTLLRQRVDGILLAAADSWSKTLAEIVDGINIPVVALNHPLLKAHVPSVVVDNYGGAFAATQHLVEHGYRRILCLGGDSHLFTIKERQKGYSAAMAGAGLTPILEPSANSYSEVANAIEVRFRGRRPVEAIFAVRNLITIYAFQAMRGLTLSIPTDGALLGFDDFELACTLRPSVTVVSQPVEALGSQAANLLFARIKKNFQSGGTGKSSSTKLAASLILRSSCGCQSPK